MPEFRIGTRMVGDDHPPLVIAEIGINHEGSLDVAVEMASAAIDAGAEVVKHQTHTLWDEMSVEARDRVPGNATESIYEIMARCALSETDERALKDFVEERGAIFISTPFSRSAVDRLRSFGVPALKIGSGECNNYPLVRYASQAGIPIIMSTGMNSIASIRPSVDIMRKAAVPFALLHCTNLYPTPPELVRLDAITELREAFPDAVVGLSDHSVTNYPCIGAVALGARILERHFTDRPDRPGPDIVCSMDPPHLSSLISASKIVFQTRGTTKAPLAEEEVTMSFAFASVAATQSIAAGDILTEQNIWVMRPGGGGYGADRFEDLLGRTCLIDVKAGTQLPEGAVRLNE